MTRVQPYNVAGFTIRGVDDWLVFATDANGAWHQWETECDRRWCLVATSIGINPNYFALSDHDRLFTTEYTLAVGVMMARDGVQPTACHPEHADELEAAFGPPVALQPHIAQDGDEFFFDLPDESADGFNGLIAKYPGTVRNDFDVFGAQCARARFAREFPQHVKRALGRPCK